MGGKFCEATREDGVVARGLEIALLEKLMLQLVLRLIIVFLIRTRVFIRLIRRCAMEMLCMQRGNLSTAS